MARIRFLVVSGISTPGVFFPLRAKETVVGDTSAAMAISRMVMKFFKIKRFIKEFIVLQGERIGVPIIHGSIRRE
jgi:hypothetical protein